eukprot:7059330-Prymnesium_polylepis.1
MQRVHALSESGDARALDEVPPGPAYGRVERPRRSGTGKDGLRAEQERGRGSEWIPRHNFE